MNTQWLGHIERIRKGRSLEDMYRNETEDQDDDGVKQ